MPFSSTRRAALRAGRLWGAFLLLALLVCATPALAGTPASTAPRDVRLAGDVTTTAPAGPVEVGVGRADLTPPTGYFTMGNVRSDARAEGQHTRLQARALVVRRGESLVALVVTDLCCVAGGLVTEAAKELAPLGFDETNLLVSATHTHTAPGQYFPFAGHDTVFPNVSTASSFAVQPDPQLYSFLAGRLATAVRRAHADLGPGALAWGHTEIPEGLTENRSIEAHLANYGIERDLGEGRPEESPHGRQSTIDPDLEVLRLDKELDGRLVPVGLWVTFANHGTVVLGSRLQMYGGDHLGAAMLVTEAEIRRRGDVPARQDVVAAFANADEGDVSSALHRTGSAAAEYVGRVEAAAMLRAWEAAGGRLQTRPAFAHRWTRYCYCGQQTADGHRIDDKAVPGLPLLSGSDEHRGQLHENTGVVLEGQRLPVEAGPQGHKVQLFPQGVPIPRGAPLAMLRLGDGVVVTNPGEVSVELGRRLKAAVRAETGLDRVAINGLAQEYLGYFTTPEEYAWQAYEGAQTNFGTHSGTLLVEQTAALARSLAQGRPAPAAYPFDPTNGLRPDPTPYPDGPDAAEATEQPADARRLGLPRFGWTGGPRGVDRPLDRAFVRLERRTARGWRAAYDDLGLTVQWRVRGDEAIPLGPGYLEEASRGDYTATWQPPYDAPTGTYRFVVTAKRYRLTSAPFDLGPSRSLEARAVRAPRGKAAFVLGYPAARPYTDFVYRPEVAYAGTARVLVAGRVQTVTAGRDGVFTVAAAPGTRVKVLSARDRVGNLVGGALAFVAGQPTSPRPREPFPLVRP